MDEAIKRCRDGGLVVIPSGPGLACDLPNDPVYLESVQSADLALPDSGLMTLWWFCFRLEKINRISGYAFLKAMLEEENFDQGTSFWIMPDEAQSEANRRWLKEEMSIDLEPEDIYVAPIYDRQGPLSDSVLLETLKGRQPSYIFVNLGSGVQERLGLYLKNNLPHNPSIIGSGAALAFLSGQQVFIPLWADKLFLGWFFRCLENPSLFIPRYWRAWKLVWLLFRHGREFPSTAT